MTKSLLAGAAALCLLAACSRTDVAQPVDLTPTPPAPVPAASSYLQDVYDLDTVYQHPFDTLARTHYEWDTQNRISTITRTEYYLNTTSLYRRSTINYYYNGTDTLAYRQIKSFVNGNNQQFRDTFDFTYAAGQMIIDSIHGTDAGNQLFRFQEAAGVVLWQQRYFNQSYTDRYYVTGNPGSRSTQLDTTIRVNGNGTSNTRTEMNVTYLGNANPFYRIAAAAPMPITPGGSLLIDNMSSAPARLIDTRNTYIAERGTYGISDQANLISYRYSLRPDGYPVRITEIYGGSRGNGSRTLVLQYR